MQRGGHPVLNGPFQSTAAFDAIWPLFAEQQQLGLALPHVLGDLPANPSSGTVRAALSADTTTVPALVAVAQRIAALGLEVRDEDGTVMSGFEADIASVDLLGDHAQGWDSRRRLEQEAARQGITLSSYTIMLSRRRAGDA